MDKKDKAASTAEVKYVHDKLNKSAGKLRIPTDNATYLAQVKVTDGKPVLVYEEEE